jgi:biopolymer transport protein ExbD
MAEMDVSDKGGHKKGPGVKKAKKGSTRVDMTPMVDLGFLLITFFMFTTTMSKPKSMEINMPFKDPNQQVKNQQLKKSCALTVLLGSHHRIYYYTGIPTETEPPYIPPPTYFRPEKGIRDVIIAKMKEIAQRKASGELGAKDNLAILIKATPNSTYKDMVDILDEMNINEVPVFAIVDISPVELEFIAKPEADAKQP